jgi:hypothetical protein
LGNGEYFFAGFNEAMSEIARVIDVAVEEVQNQQKI